MLKLSLTWLVALAISIAQACAPLPSTPDPNTVNTAVAQTVSAVSSLTAQPPIPVTGQESPTATQTVSPQAPTQTPLVLISPNSVFTVTSVSTAAQVSVSTPTNCRVGPGIAYERLGGLQVGQVAEVVGRNTAGSYWIIRNPARAGQLCWLWGQFATVTGDTSVLPIYTPPPTPTPLPTNTPAPGFTAAYSGIEICTGTGWWVEIKLDNTGAFSFESLALTVRDTTTDTVLSLYADNFTNRNGCNETDARENLPAGSSLIVSSPVFNYDPTGRALRANVTLCSGSGQNGTCITQVVNFTP